MKKQILIICFLVLSILGAKYAFAESTKHKRFNEEKHIKFLEEKKAKREQLVVKLKKDSEEINKRMVEMKVNQDKMIKGNSSNK